MDQERKLNQRLYDALPTVPAPNLEEIKIKCEFEREWKDFEFPAQPEQIAESFYRKGRIAGKSAAAKEILGSK